jgi:hypothetical protein
MYEFISALALTDLGLELNKKYANLSALLQREEASFMADVMAEMYNNGVKFIPIYDSLIIKASDREKAKFHFNNIIRSHKLEGILTFS